MRISQTTGLSKPEGSTKISPGTLSYICARNRQRAYNLVIKELKDSGISQADLSRRLDWDPALTSRVLNRPRNWEIDTFSCLLFGISGAVPTFEADHPLERPTFSFTKKQAVSNDDIAPAFIPGKFQTYAQAA
jgi:hypothetical protein